MDRRTRLAWWAVGMIVLVVGIKLASRDDPPPADADILPAANAPGPDDGYPVFARMAAAFPLSPKDVEILGKQVEAEAPDEALVASDISRSSETLALFADFSRRAAFADPSYPDASAAGPSSPIPQFFPMVAAARMTSLQARSLLKKGRASEAMAKALTIVDAGRVLMRRSQLIEQFVGYLVADLGAKRALQIAKSGKLDRAGLLNAAARLSAPSGAAAGLQEALRWEYAAQIRVVDHLSEYGAAGPEGKYTPRNLAIAAVANGGWYVYLPRRTKGMFAAGYHALVAAAAVPCLRARLPQSKNLPIGAGPNVIGRVLYNIAIPSFEKLYTRRCESDFRLAAAADAAALQAYRLDHGRFPAKLGDLTPRYLAAPPVDPYSGESPLYSPETGEVRSAAKTLGVSAR